MAMLNPDQFKKIDENHQNNIHEPVEATYKVFTKNGETIFQINSSKRLSTDGKTKQTLQMNEQMAIKLIKILREEFKLI